MMVKTVAHSKTWAFPQISAFLIWHLATLAFKIIGFNVFSCGCSEENASRVHLFPCLSIFNKRSDLNQTWRDWPQEWSVLISFWNIFSLQRLQVWFFSSLSYFYWLLYTKSSLCASTLSFVHATTALYSQVNFHFLKRWWCYRSMAYRHLIIQFPNESQQVLEEQKNIYIPRKQGHSTTAARYV